MKNKDLIKYYLNGKKKYEIYYYDSGSIDNEQFYDIKGRYHRNKNLPDCQVWYENGMLANKSYARHGKYYNLYGPADIDFHENGKIIEKWYYLNNLHIEKLTWVNQIKNI